MSITAHIDPRAVQLSLRGQTRDEVLGELVALIPELAGRAAEQAALREALIARERMQTTALGDGLALPHTRQVLSGLLQRPLIVLGRHEKGIAYGAADGKPTRLFLLLLAPNSTEHLRLLASISRLLRDPKVKEELLRAVMPEEALRVLQMAESKV